MNTRIDDNYWMTIVAGISYASTCRKHLGCVLVKNKYIVGMGYVGSVHGDNHCTIKNDTSNNNCLLVENNGLFGSGDRKSCIRTIHAEMNAILNMQQVIRGEEDNWISCYSTYQPCLNCTKALLQIGVRKFRYAFPYKDNLRDSYILELSNDIIFDFTMEVNERR